MSHNQYSKSHNQNVTAECKYVFIKHMLEIGCEAHEGHKKLGHNDEATDWKWKYY